MKLNYELVSTVFLIGFVGCAASQTIIPRLEIVDVPSVNEAHVVELGDTLVSKGKVYTFDGMQLNEEVTSGDGALFVKLTIPPGMLKALKEDSSWIYFYADDFVAQSTLRLLPRYSGGLKRSKITGKVMVFSDGEGIWDRNLNPQPNYELKKAYALDKPSFRQELIYNGKVGNNVKFLYRELSNDYMRPSFSQEVQYDLKESKMVGFKGVRIEILEATNTSIKYIVHQSFPDVL